MYCVNLVELDLTHVLKNIARDVPEDFVECLKTLSVQAINLKKLGLANNFFGDMTLEVLVSELFPKLPYLESIDLSANKLTDHGIRLFFQTTVAKNEYLKSIILNYNKIKDKLTVTVIAETINSSYTMEELSFKMCGLKLDFFKELISS